MSFNKFKTINKSTKNDTSIFDMLKIGIRLSSSHTLDPWLAAERWINHLKKEHLFTKTTSIKIAEGGLAVSVNILDC